MSTPPSPVARMPEEVASAAVDLGVAKARRGTIPLLALGVLGGAFIAMGSLFFALIVTGSPLGFGPTRLLGGLGFSLGLMLVVVAGAELFTGNALIAVAWAERRITARDVLRNWALVYCGNLGGALLSALLAWIAGVHLLGDGQVGATLLALATRKAALPPVQAIASGVLCNALVCIGVWLALAGRSVADKLLAVLLPVAAFVALGFEHCVANMLFLPFGLLLADDAAALLPGAAVNLACVTLGNVLGGTLLVAGVYWVAYLRDRQG